MKKKYFKIVQGLRLNPIGLVMVWVFLSISAPLSAESNIDQGFIYGRITLTDGSTLQGPIRWGTEETFWHDMFNSSKEENEYSVYLSSKDLKEINRKSHRGSGFERFLRRVFGGFERYSDELTNHQFVCRFGELKEMKLKGRSTVILTFKDGKHLIVSGGSNDIRATITILDQESGETELKWDKIRTIEFLPVLQQLKEKFGQPLYGTVSTRSSQFKGYIQWDHQECVNTDKLDGECDDEDISIEFGEIKSIEKFRSGSLVTLHSGKEYYVHGTNDVDDDNRGIVINDLNFGKILVEWDEFDQVVFEKNPGNLPAGYDDYSEPKELIGKVRTRDGKEYAGRIVYDLDEALDFEIISGYQEDIQYEIPLRNIKTITPSGSCCSKITLKNGSTIELEEERDIDKDNDGLLVWGDAEEPTYLAWSKIKEITFN